ncbi:MAG: N-acetylneuraminate synthase [Gammaproteobacteria bacterium]|jgi:N-acetylneuraminate synthase|nr:N-acetylneuraminate synthase [Gammaproteobacteria bacterium]
MIFLAIWSKKMHKTLIIAEAGVNHNGSIELAKALIDKAAEAGADIVKFQTFKAKTLASSHAPKAQYQLQTTDKKESQLAMLQKLELDEQAHQELISYCQTKQIQFLSSPFDIDSLKLLVVRFGLRLIKIPSGEITNAPLLLETARNGCKVILSTGMSTLGEIEDALAVLAYGYINGAAPSIQAFKEAYQSAEGQAELAKNVSLLHCTSQYPTPFEDVNLFAMDTLKMAFGLEVGFSDHTQGINVPIAAVARGALVIEKHFTLDRNMEGPDHKASLEPDELKEMVKAIRQVELSLGRKLKAPVKSELDTAKAARKSLVAAIFIHKGEILNESNVAILRAGHGISPMHYWELLGKAASRDYQQNESIDE